MVSETGGWDKARMGIGQQQGPVLRAAPRRSGTRLPVTLACADCKARNYKTSKSADLEGAIELKKFCKQCKKHTVHRETK